VQNELALSMVILLSAREVGWKAKNASKIRRAQRDGVKVRGD